VIADSATAEERRGAEILRSEIADRLGWKLPVVRAKGAGAKTNAIVFDGPHANAWGPSLQQAKLALPAPAKPEGYSLQVTPRLVSVTGRDARGCLWGAQTLVQLLDGNGSSARILPATIRDWPSLGLRGVHLFHGNQALPFHSKLIDRVLSRYKMNALFLQVEQVRWGHDPKVAPAWAGTPQQLKQEIAFARSRGITTYPLMQGFGHMEWLLKQGGKNKYAEDPLTPYALNFTNPQAVTYLEGFMREADSLFNAPAFHVGLDEVTMRGRFPYRSKPKGDFPTLYVKGAKHWHDFFAKRGKPMMMWADMALHAGEAAPSFGTSPTPQAAKRIRAGLPKDVWLVDWQYGEHNDFPSLRQLKQAGFKNLYAATWYRTKNIQNFTKQATQIGAKGAIQTTWAGYESKADALNKWDSRRQFTAMILAADYFWNGGEGPAPDKLPYDPTLVFGKAWDGK
jgi:hypothetical protein